MTARFLAGFGASAIYAPAGGVLSDVWRPCQRGKSLGIYLLIPLLGAAIGPITGGFMADRTAWRWMFSATSAFQGVMAVVSYFAFRETYAPVILKRKAEMLQQDNGETRYHTAAETLMEGLTAVGLLYIVPATFATLWTNACHERTDISGLHYIAVALGEIAGSEIGDNIIDRIVKRLSQRKNGETAPEFHVPLMLPATVISSAGLLLYGWAAQAHIYWLVVDVGVFLTCFEMQIGGRPKRPYMVDAYPEYAGLATAASQFMRSMTAFAFSLLALKMYEAMGYGWVTACLPSLGSSLVCRLVS
ncbi:hypothetical protein LTR56_025175 [Elasticomyces elasticus]|nr:hypothetical protein LTR56_025175 [Elasticomyces elasticus]KAK3621068.1 hypothetical protein LTR22_025353 [Elasticomyces elasticus]KAK4904529.1 hypothetical protein LTR49_026028 [Elasticomyces elasticus]KAK5740847.1 hypothetical protein LTS12_024822 [Elasticomyces elasticus]